jgi:hypothetical protein
MLLMDIPPWWHGVRYRHRVVRRDKINHKYQRPAWTGQLRLPLTHHECLTCGKRWTADP